MAKTYSAKSSVASNTQPKADAWINFHVSVGGKHRSIGGIPLNASNALQAQLIAELKDLEPEDQKEVILALLTKGNASLYIAPDEAETVVFDR